MDTNGSPYELTADFREAKAALLGDLDNLLKQDINWVQANLVVGDSQRNCRIEDACCGHLRRSAGRIWNELLEPAPLTSARRAELLRRLLNESFEQIVALVHSCGGYDAVTAFKQHTLQEALAKASHSGDDGGDRMAAETHVPRRDAVSGDAACNGNAATGPEGSAGDIIAPDSETPSSRVDDQNNVEDDAKSDPADIWRKLVRAQENVTESERRLSKLEIDGLNLEREKDFLVLNAMKAATAAVIQTTLAGRRPRTSSQLPKTKMDPERRAGRPPKGQTREIHKEWIKQGSPELNAKVCDKIGAQFFLTELYGKKPGSRQHKRVRERVRKAIQRAQHN